MINKLMDNGPEWFVILMCWIDSNILFPIDVFKRRYPKAYATIKTLMILFVLYIILYIIYKL